MSRYARVLLVNVYIFFLHQTFARIVSRTLVNMATRLADGCVYSRDSEGPALERRVLERGADAVHVARCDKG